MTDRAVVIGAGHNGLVAACYLARDGYDVEVVEQDTVLGGAVSTVERWPGYRVDRGSSAHIMIRHTGIIEDLQLDLEYLDLDPWGFAPFGDDSITFHVDLDKTCASIEKACGTRDAEAYRAFVTDWSTRNLKVFQAFQGAPTPARLGRAIWGAGKGTGLSGYELSRQFLTSADSLLDEHFDDERLKTALAWLGAQSGPPTHEPATADLVGWSTVNHLLAPGHPKGGSGMLSEALASRLRSYGGRVRLGDGAARMTRQGTRVTGVVTSGGEHLRADAVVAGCHVLTTLELLDDRPLLDRARRTVRVGNGIGMVVRLATTDLPRYPTATEETYRAMQLLAPSRQALRKAHGEWNAGLPPTEPAALAMTFSAFDDTLAPAGHHTVTVWGQWHP
ncbi:MAG: NAD(P)/FAD-dependent oxidoreductase [Frankiales bacterium]|nr:NAD(P)/FAD-dependent oxidoreductase [Frankiales bacterium]